VSKDPSDPTKADPKAQERTRLNAELAHQYGQGRRRRRTEGALEEEATPGRNALTGELEEVQPDGAEVDVEEKDVAPVVAAKSIFELPRREPSRQPLLNADNVTSSSPSEPAAPAAPFGKPTRRG
jgi:hypothetical protein